MINFNIYIENEYPDWEIDEEKLEKSIIDILNYYMKASEIYDFSCLSEYKFSQLSFDILFTDGKRTHEINREYRQKDKPADIITFAVFADSPNYERFVLDDEINLGECILGLDRVESSAIEKGISKEAELIFLISHGILHLLGFDHQTEAEFEFVVKHQKDALKSIGIKYDKI